MKKLRVVLRRQLFFMLLAAGAALTLLGLLLIPLTSLAADETITAVTPEDLGIAYVAMSGSHEVAMIDTSSHAYLGAIDLDAAGCFFPWRVALSPDESQLYVSCNDSNSVAVIDTSSNTVLANIPNVLGADGISFVRGGDFALVGSRFFNHITVIDTSSMSVDSTISTPGNTRSLAANPLLGVAYATSQDGNILVIDTNTFTIADTIFVGGDPWDVVLSPDGQWLFAGDRWGGGMHVIDANTHTLVTTIPVSGTSLTGLSVAPDGTKLFAGGLGAGVHVFDIPSLTFETTIPLSGSAWATAVNCDGSELYIGDVSNSVPVIDTASYTLLLEVPVGGFDARDIAICPELSVSGVNLYPPSQSNDGALGEIVLHELSLINATDSTDSYTLTLGATVWDSLLSDSQVGPLLPGEIMTFTLSVTVPAGVDWYEMDGVTITATSVTSPSVYSDTAVVTTRAYASPQIDNAPDEFTSTQLVNAVVTQSLTISNGNGVTLTYDIVPRSAFAGVIDQLGHGRSQPERQFLQALAGQADDGHNTGLPTVGHYPVEALRQLQGPVNILAWITYADINEEYENSLNAIAQYTTYSLNETTTADPAQLASLLQQADVFLVPEQENTSYGAMYNLGLSWQSTLNDFLANGGTIVVMEHCQGSSGLFAGAGLMTVDYWNCTSDATVEVTAPDHPLAQDLPATFVGLNGRAEYSATSGETIITSQVGGFVTVAADEVNGGNIVMLGFDFFSYNDDMARLLANAVLWQTGDLSWLTAVPVSGTVATNGSDVVDVVMNAANRQPGVYAANLQINHNDETQNRLQLPVTMTVQPTANMGWVEGTVTDAGTSLPLEATVIAQGQPYTITSDADTGYYQLWLDAGSYTLQVSADGYVTETRAINITAQAGTAEDFDLVLNVPVLALSSDDMSVSQNMGQMTTRMLTITNQGPAPLEFVNLALGSGYTPLMPLWPHQLPAAGDVDGNSRLPATGPLTGVTPPTHLEGNPVLIIQDEYPWGLDFIQQILTFHGIAFDQVDSGMMGTVELSAYRLVIVPSVQPSSFYSNWNTHIGRFEDYVAGGGALWFSGTTQGDTPLVPGGIVNHYGPSSYNDILQPDHPWVVGVPNPINGSFASHNYFTNLPAASLVVATSQNNSEPTLVDYRLGAGRVMLTGQTLEIAWAYGWNGAPILENSLLDMAMWQPVGVPWLTIEPVSGTVPGYAATAVAVTFDATGQQPGTYTADIIVSSNAPVNGVQTVPVTMTLSPAPGMGRVMGTVTDLWTADPLTATVQLVGVYTGTANPDYTIWADPGVYDLVAWADGYMTQTHSVDIPADGLVVQDIALEPAQPRLEGMPESLTISAIPGIAFSQTIVLTNSGPLPLDYAWYEIPPPMLQTQAPADLEGKVILYDRVHGQNDLSNYTTLAAAINNAGGLLSENFAPITAAILTNVDVLWVDCCGYSDWTFSELTAVSDWLQSGGAVLVHSPYNGTAYEVAEIYDIFYDCCNYSSGITTDITPHPTTTGVDAIYLDGSSETLTATQAAIITVFDTNGLPQAVAQEQNGGKMVVIDSILFGNFSIAQADNALFALNVLTWLADPAYGDVPWLAITPITGTILGHRPQEMTIWVDTTGMALGTYEAELALEHNDPDQDSPATFPVTLDVSEQAAAVSLTPATAVASGEPGTSVTYTLTVRNMGNGPDSFDIAVSGDWVATPSLLVTDELLPNQRQQFTVVVQVPASAGPDETNETTVTVTSQFDPAVTQTAVLSTSALSADYLIYLPVMRKP